MERKYNYYENKDLKLSVVTDTHFGRTFKEGIPLNRRGEYEEKIYNDFENFMYNTDSKFVVHGGDLFDSPFVSNEVLMRIFNIIWTAAYRHPHTFYYFIAGNHDLSKNEEQGYYTSFHILNQLLNSIPNIIFIESTEDLDLLDEISDLGVLLIPYSHFETADDIIREHVKEETMCIIGHFDDPVPQTLANFKGTKLSGHFHKKHLTQDGTLFIGSFYPIAFGEESDNSLMETMTLEEYNKKSESELKDKRVRILLKEGEELPVESPCLQLISKKEKKEEIQLSVEPVMDFDFKDLFFECLKESEIAEEVWYKYLSLKGNE